MTSVESVRQRMLSESDVPRRQRPLVGAATIGLLTILLLGVVHMSLEHGLPASVRRGVRRLQARHTTPLVQRQADPMFQPF